MKFLIVKSAALTLAFLGQAAATENTINIRGAVFAATNEDWEESADADDFAQFGEDVAAIRDSGAEVVLVSVPLYHFQ
jgi:hypothetical protein